MEGQHPRVVLDAHGAVERRHAGEGGVGGGIQDCIRIVFPVIVEENQGKLLSIVRGRGERA